MERIAATIIFHSGTPREITKKGMEAVESALQETDKQLRNGNKSLINEHFSRLGSIGYSSGNHLAYIETELIASELRTVRTKEFIKKKDDKPKVSLMSIHQSKGLEYPYVYIVGLEENLFPSAMSMNTRSELEEERRLFYVALTRAEKVAYLTYTKTRYRWGKLIDCEPSRFLEEIDEQYLEYITPKKLAPSVNRFLNEDIFGDAPKKIRFQKPIQRRKFEKKQENKVVFTPPKNLKKITHTQPKTNLFDNKIIVGNIIEHNRFGRGEVLSLEGKGPNKKAEIQFGTVGKKKLLLQFAKLKVIG